MEDGLVTAKRQPLDCGGFHCVRVFIGMEVLFYCTWNYPFRVWHYCLLVFYVQHQHEHAYKQWKENWDYVVAAIRGSTYYKLPRIWQWLTGNIGIHHIHHLSSRIPNYNLEKCMKENKILSKYVTTIGFVESLQMIKNKLWDEERQK